MESHIDMSSGLVVMNLSDPSRADASYGSNPKIRDAVQERVHNIESHSEFKEEIMLVSKYYSDHVFHLPPLITRVKLKFSFTPVIVHEVDKQRVGSMYVDPERACFGGYAGLKVLSASIKPLYGLDHPQESASPGDAYIDIPPQKKMPDLLMPETGVAYGGDIFQTITQPIMAIGGQAIAGAMSYQFTSPKHSLIKSFPLIVTAFGCGLTALGFAVGPAKPKLSNTVKKVGTFATASAIIASLAGLLPPVVGWTVGPAVGILVGTSLALA